MKKIIKFIMILILFISSFSFGATSFLNGLTRKDTVNALVSNDTIENYIDDNLKELLKQSLIFKNISTTLLDQIVDDIEDDSDSFDKIKKILLQYKDTIYNSLNTNINKDEYDKLYNDELNTLSESYSSLLSELKQDQTIKPIIKVYKYSSKTYIYISLFFMIISLVYLIYTSYKDKLISKGITLSLLLSGISLFIFFFLFLLILSSIPSTSTTIQITSSKYIYICGITYIALGFIGLITNAFLKRRLYNQNY